ncbi:type I restriction endonuclease subunit S [Vibrio parahaemolyticus]|uniref:restriction endonuclease subunit S n=1 Tax=Vibrio parahaemolyticus TaxID=670 RepID=UPI001123265B|nr:restriction endonuclease subunit S [Vibrio parahaemolyticus]TOC06147.1 type I restriction endonuclease subunit S [Vibrio parahaemolyticus]
MASNLTSMRLADCMDAIIDYRGKTPTKTTSGIPLITAKIIKNGRIQDVNEYIAEDDYDAWMRRGIPKEGDVVLTTEAPLGEVAQLDSRKIALAQRVITLRGKKGVLDNDYLLYLLQSHDVQHQLDGRGTGSTVKGIKQSELKEIILSFPSINAQKRIAQHLKNIDNKITLNRQINQTLEQMAQTLFKSWFVDFDPVMDNALDAGSPIPDELQHRVEARKAVRESEGFKPLPDDVRQLFPDAFEESELGWVPKGWVVSNLSTLIDIKHGFAFKGEHFSDKETSEILLTPGNVKIGGGFKADKFKYYDGPIEDNYVFSVGDMFVTMTDLSKASDTLGYPAIVPDLSGKRLHHNQRLGKVLFSDHPASKEMFVYHNLCSTKYRQSVVGSATGTTVKHTAPKKILAHTVVHTPDGLLESEFERQTSAFKKMAAANDKSTNTLTKLRDTLLPKLISGELRLDDVEAAVEQETVSA